MKARFFKKVGLGLVLSSLPFVGACNQQPSNAPQSLVTAAQAEPSAAVATNVATAAATETTLPAGAEPVPVPAPNAAKTLPPNIKPSSPLAEVVKLAQAGVDENVMLTYVNNSGSMFNLASDEIIYLNDIGVADSVVTAMMQRDQALKQTWTETAQAQNAAAQASAQNAQAAAPTYVEPPQPDAQPAQAVEAAPAQPANVTYNYFYDSLSPYGTWIDVDGYGRCWQPTVVVLNSGWRPYFDRGRWLYTDAGWYWHSDYSWGWATFHYGRWFSHPRWGWCWYPGHVWGPSWVTWRYSGDYCGWAPLPPAAYYQPGFGFYYQNRSVGIGFGFGLGVSAYNFVSWGNFCDSRPWHHRVPASRVTQIYNNTTIVNNVITGDNNTIINRGIAVDRVREHSRSEIRQVAIRENSSTAGFSGRRERLERDGRTLLVHRADIPESAADTGAPARVARESRLGHTPSSGAGAAAQMEAVRGQGHARMSAEARERSLRTTAGAPSAVTSSKPAANRTAVQAPSPVTGNIRSTPSITRPTPGDSSVGSRSRDERPNTPNRDRTRDGGRSLSTPPLIVRGEQQVNSTPSSPLPQSSPTASAPSPRKSPSNLVVIGRRDSTPARTDTSSRSTHDWIADRTPTTPTAASPQVQAPRASAPVAPPSSSYSQPTAPAARYERSAPTRNFSPPARTYTAPPSSSRSASPQSVAPAQSAPRSTPTPTYSAPRSSPSSVISIPRSSPSPSYSAPRSSPAPSPSYSAPRSSHAPPPSYTPSPSRGSSHSSGRSESGGRWGNLRKD